MTATIISFPTMIERDDAQFIRTGQTSYTWAGAESSALYDALWASGMPARLPPRIAVLAETVERLGRTRPEAVGDMVLLSGGVTCELRLMPDFLRAICRHREDADSGAIEAVGDAQP